MSMVAYTVRSEPPAELTMIVDHGDKQLNCRISFKIHQCVQTVRELRTRFLFDIIVSQLTAATAMSSEKGFRAPLSHCRCQT